MRGQQACLFGGAKWAFYVLYTIVAFDLSVRECFFALAVMRHLQVAAWWLGGSAGHQAAALVSGWQ